MSLRGFLQELHRRNVFKLSVAYTAAAVVLLEVLTHLFRNFEAPHWVLKVITTLLNVGLLPKYQEYMEKIKPVIKALCMEASSANIVGVEGF